MVTPSLAKFSFPPEWSPCTWVFTRNRSGAGESPLNVATIFSVTGANCESTRNTPSGPTSAAIRPP